MIVDVMGVELTPGNVGADCLGNGTHFYEDGTPIECCCDECDYYMCCCGLCDCEGCTDADCPHAERASKEPFQR